MPRGPKGEKRRADVNARAVNASVTRLTNAFSKKFENHCHSLALYFFWYNWVRVHKTLGLTPARVAGPTQDRLSFHDLLTVMDADEQHQIIERRQAVLDASEQLSRSPQSN